MNEITLLTTNGIRNRTLAFLLFILLMINLAVNTVHMEMSRTGETGKNIEPYENTADGKTRYSGIFTEEFDSRDNIDDSKTTCSVNTYEGKAHLWSSIPITPPTDMGTKSIDTRSHGGGYSPKYNEYWYPQWSGTTIYRYDSNRNYIGNFGSGQSSMMQVWGDTDGTYYTANWGNDRVYKWSDRGSSQQWSYHVGGTAGGVCCDDQYVYAIRHGGTNIFVLNKDNGNHVRNINLPGYTNLHGGMAYANGIIYLGGDHGWGGGSGNSRIVNMIKASDGSYIGSFQVGNSIYSAAFNGEEYWISPNSGTVWCYRISEGNSYGGQSSEAPFDTSHVQSNNVHEGSDSIGAVKLTVTETVPQGTEIIYRMSLDGAHWEVVERDENHVFGHYGTGLYWNATFKTDDRKIKPYIEELVIEYDLVSQPVTSAPEEDVWLSDFTPTLEWNFTDPDLEDEQKGFSIEMYRDKELNEQVYGTGWIESSNEHFAPNDALSDGVYYWRVRTEDDYGGRSNFSAPRKLLIDLTEPEGNLTIENGAFSVNEREVELYVEASDGGSGVAELQIINDQGIPGKWMDFTERENLVLTAQDGLKTVGVRLRDTAGLESEIIEDSIYLDLLGPGEIIVTSSTHPDPEKYYNSEEPVFAWETPHDISGIKGYSYTVDQGPVTIPNTMIYVQDPEMTETVPGEFKNLMDGIWYFHIVACDILDQWGEITHFPFNVDRTAPTISSLGPDNRAWYNHSYIELGATFQDLGGSGIDTSKIEFSYKTPENPHYSSWSNGNLDVTILERGTGPGPLKVRAAVNILLDEGINTVKWRVSDLAGNGPVASQEWILKMDSTPVTFEDPVPKKSKVFSDTTVECGITVNDDLGSGVDGTSIEYSISGNGDDEEGFIKWTWAGMTGEDNMQVVKISVTFPPGRENYIKWRAKDMAGNGAAFSDAYQVQINSPPLARITSPPESEMIGEKEKFTLSAGGSLDADGDTLSYYWTITDKRTGAKVFGVSGKESSASLGEGNYAVKLFVNDGNGYNVSSEVDIWVTGDGKGSSGGDGGGIGAFFSEWCWLGLAFFIMLQIALMFFMARRYRAKKEEEPTPRSVLASGFHSPGGDRGVPPMHPYGQGEHLPAMQNGYGDRSPAGSAPALPGSSWGTQQTQFALPPGPQTATGGMPQHSQNQGIGQRGPQQSPGNVHGTQFTSGTGPHTAAYQPSVEAAPVQTPSYNLPRFSTEQGKQNLNRMALPPAMIDNTGLGTEPAPAPRIVPSPAPATPIRPSIQAPVSGTTQPAVPQTPIESAPAPRIVQEQVGVAGSLPGQTGQGQTEYISPGQTGNTGELDEIFQQKGTAMNQSSHPSSNLIPPASPDFIKCHACGSMNPILTKERPTIIVCTSCREQGYLAA